MENSRPLPRSPESERAVLGGLMVDPDKMADIAEILLPEDFYRENRQSGPAGFNPDEQQVI